MTLGIGAGQMSRIDSAEIASVKPKKQVLILKELLWLRMRFFHLEIALMKLQRMESNVLFSWWIDKR